MTPREVATVLRELAQLLQLKNENSFKIRAYEMGADAFEGLPADPAAPGGLNERVQKGTLTELSGVGKAIQDKVSELVKTGRMTYLEDLRKEFPHGALDLVQIPGLGPRKAVTLIKELDVASLDDLEKAAKEGRVRGLKGFGEKTEKLILEGIPKVRERQQARKPLWETRPLAEKLLERIRQGPGVTRAEIAGSVRRYAETNADIDIVCAAPAPEPVMEVFVAAPGVLEVLARGGTKCSVRISTGKGAIQADLRVVTEPQFATALHHFTGSKQHHVRLRGIARDKGLSISEYGLSRIDGGPPVPIASEDELYQALGLKPVPPELREDKGEIELAQGPEGLPELVREEDIQGFVHCHSTWSDGNASIEEMASAAKELGRKFITISDHTRAAHYANGLEIDRLKRQWEEIAAVEEKVGIRVLRAAEVDILQDGALDLPDDILRQLDVVICSVHQRFKLEDQTDRVRRALEHPLCQIWGHPTGRYLADRDPMPAKWEELIEVAVENGVTIECNGTPHRLDFNSDLLLVARKHGAKVSLSVDAHSTKELRNLHYAVGTARRGWTEKARVVNARPANEFLSMLRAKA